MRRLFFTWIFKAAGWRVIGGPPDLKKYVIAVAPHTSNIDFFVGLPTKYIYPEFEPRFLAKNSLFKIPIVGWFLRSIGGYEVDRTKNTKLVDQIVDIFEREDKFVMTIAPEGTRSYVPKWKTGFYWVAVKAKVPIVMVGFDYERKVVEFKEAFEPSGDVDKDLEMMKAYFRTIKGKNPEKGVL